MRSPRGDSDGDTPRSIGSRRQQLNAYNDAVDESPIIPRLPHAPFQGRPPDPPAATSSSPQHQSPQIDGVVRLLERLTEQFEASRTAQEQAVTSLGHRLDDFVNESSDQVHDHLPDSSLCGVPPAANVSDCDRRSSQTKNDVQHAS
jgi:hypothetical protein